MEHSLINEDGSIRYDYRQKSDPFALESIRASFERVDKDLESRGLHWERVVVSGRGCCIYEQAPPIVPQPDPVLVCMAIGLKEGQEPTKEQTLIMDHFVKQCCQALDKYQEDGTLPTEEMAKYLGRKGVKTDVEELKELLGIDVVKFGPSYCIRQEDGTLVPWLSHSNSTPKE